MTTSTIDDLASGCHSLVLRLPDTADAQRLLSGVTPGPVHVWRTEVPAGSDEPTARDRRRTEALRPLHRDGPPLRAVALQYTDGATDLVLVAVRTVIPPAALLRIARTVLDGSGDLLPPVPAAATRPAPVQRGRLDWGLGDPRLLGVTGSTRIDLTSLPAGAERFLPAAIALAVSRYSGGDPTALGVLDLENGPGEDIGVHALDAPRQGTIADLLHRLDQPPTAPQEPPPVGVVLSPAFEDGTYTACLAPVFPLTVQLDRGCALATCWFDQGIVDATVARQFCGHVAHLAGQLVAGDAQRPQVGLELLPQAEQAALLQAGRAGADGDSVPVRGRIDRAFEAVAAKQPQAVALVAGEEELTYRQLDERAEAVAAGLRALDVPPGSRIGVCLDRDAELVVTLLGVLKADCAYVPMDPRYPAQRLSFTTRNAELPVVITTAAEFPAEPGTRVLTPQEVARPAAKGAAAGPGRRPAGEKGHQGDDPAYVIYTSGSTGTPKGVVVPHRNVLALLRATERDFALGPDDTWTLFHSSAFDFSVWEMWGCLLTGGRLIVVPYWTTRDTDEFYTLLAEQRVTVLNQTPSAFAQLIRHDQHARRQLALRLVIFGGEPLDARMLAPWFARHPATDCPLVNMFGITETTVHVTAQTVTPHEVVTGSRSVGRPLPGWSVSVRDEQGRVLPPGPAGEIYVGGAGVADRYLGLPELTRQRFVVDETTGERVYRSGDKGRLRPDGRLDHLGRLDNQVKIRGHRIELDEIRAVLMGAPHVTAAAVVVNRDQPDDPAGSRIDAYVVLTTAAEADRAQVLAHARATLPDYMMPATLTPVSEIPLTINGKPDTSKLPDPRAAAPAGLPEARQPVEAEAASGAVPDALADTVLSIWSKQLNTPVKPQDNFFVLGGNSLLVVRVLAEMRERNLPKVSLKQFYRHSTAAEFTELVRQLQDSSH
ncbi:amino acid adenylation domain-containing protein [Streptomyces sp. SudanB52_2052]|uniref:amino acid adenylation domain-containing protein n=1 Tax=Streptomyces sp. SudanB52_2052 TaxID=3035276 RepID=UPI003F576486